MLIAGACLSGCLAAPGDAPADPRDDGSVASTGDGAFDPDAPLPVCGDGTGLSIMHISTIQVPATDETITLPALAVFSNTGTTTIDTGQIRIVGISTITSASLAIAIADAGEDLPAGESHGYLDETSRTLMQELIEGLWSDQERPEVIATLSHSITSGTFEATVDYRLGELGATVDLTFSVGGDPMATGGARVDFVCP